MDFIVGGMPRGGTTALSIVFNLHPDSFCYAAESHLMPLLLEFAQDAPAPSGSLKGLRKILEAQNHQVLIEMPRFSVKSGASDRWVIFDEPAVAKVNNLVMELLEQGLYGRELCEAALRRLSGVIREKSGKAVVGEKTPSNVFAFREYGSIGTKLAPVLLREPFSVIKSMQTRGEDKTDQYNSPFKGQLVELIGLYLSYAEAVRDSQSQQHIMVVKYEELLKNSTEIVSSMYKTVGLRDHPRAIELAVKSLKIRSGEKPWETFSPPEQALIWHVTSAVRHQLGYGAEFYESQGYAPTSEQLHLPCDETIMQPIYGYYAKHVTEGGMWLMKDSCIVMQVSNTAKSVEMKFWSEFPDAVSNDDTLITLSALESSAQAPFAQISVGKKATYSTLALDVASMTPAYRGANGSIYVFNLKSSHAYRRTVTPQSRFKIFFGADRRQLAFNHVETKVS